MKKLLLMLNISFLALLGGCFQKTYTINFECDDFEVSAITVASKESFELPSLEKVGYTFLGWFPGQGPNYGEFTDQNEITSDLTLYARWQVNQYTISYDSQGGSIVESVSLDYNSEIPMPEIPTKDGYVFMGWFLEDGEFSSIVDLVKMPAEDLTLYAEWADEVYPLTVGVSNLWGDYIPGWLDNDGDKYVQTLIHGYQTLVETKDGNFVWDTTVLKSPPDIKNDEIGNRTYTFTLHEDLFYNNGDQVTAKCYVANILMRASAEWNKIARRGEAEYLLGYDLYRGQVIGLDNSGNKKYDPNHSSYNQFFSGVRLLSEYQFSLTIDAQHLPYFWADTVVNSSPINLSAYMPGFDIKDYGLGAYITNISASKTLLQTLEASVGSPAKRSFPSVTTGAYEIMISNNQTVLLEKNPYFKSNYLGQTPEIYRIIIKKYDNLSLEKIANGEFDIVARVSDKDVLDDVVGYKDVSSISYTRNGYGMISYKCSIGPTKYLEVRQALSFLIDRNVFLTDFLGGYGLLVDGPYGQGQSFYQESKDDLTNLIKYRLDINIANQILDQSPYRFEVDGVTPFDKNKVTEHGNYFRYDQNGNRLEINFMSTVQNLVSDLIQSQYNNTAWQAGVRFSSIFVTWDVFISVYYHNNNPINNKIYTMFSSAMNFDSIYDPYLPWHGDTANTVRNPYQLNDSQLNEIIERMNVVNPNDKEAWRQEFVNFVHRWNHLIPTLPIYVNEYFDIYNNKVKGLNPNSTSSWAHEIFNITIE